jgi:serine/threonine-protein kinase
MIHTTLGRYRILGELGRGAMGTVYRAHDPLIEREVAVKTLHPDLPEDVIAEVRERFLREAKSAGRLNHPNIVTIFDVGEHDGVAYMAMELLEGRSLQQILGESARLPFQTIADLVAQIADALDRAQQLGIVHRDVKPANVVVSASGHAKLTDFGVAFVPASTMTQTGTMIGSPRYMSPEQVLGLPIDPRSDIFSLGVVLYEMLAGRAPFVRPEDSTIFPLINRIAAEPHPPVTQVDPSIPAAFDIILSKALAKKPEDRYQRAGEMANDLRNLRSFEPSSVARAQADGEKTMVLARGPQTDQPQYEKTVVLPAAAQAASTPSPEAERKAGAFVLDLDAFSRNFDVEEQARQRAEEETRRKKEEELRRWSETEVHKRETFERQRLNESQRSGATSVTGADTGSRRGALDLLKKKATTRSLEDDTAAKKAKADAGLDQSMHVALQYLAEVARELNGVNPTAGRPYDYVFLGRLPAVKLSNAFADLRSRKINGKDHGEHLFFRFRAQPTAPAKAILLGAEIARFHEYFKALSIPFEAGSEAKSDFGKVTRAAFTVSAPLPCEVNIRADYDDSSVEIELVNVRRPGRVRCRLEPKKFDDVVDDLARYILGVDDDFDQILNRR